MRKVINRGKSLEKIEMQYDDNSKDIVNRGILIEMPKDTDEFSLHTLNIGGNDFIEVLATLLAAHS